MHNSNATTNTNISKNRAACLEVCQVYLKLHIELPNFFDFLQYVANVTHELTQDLADTGDQKFGCMGEIWEMSKHLFGKGVGPGVAAGINFSAQLFSSMMSSSVK